MGALDPALAVLGCTDGAWELALVLTLGRGVGRGDGLIAVLALLLTLGRGVGLRDDLAEPGTDGGWELALRDDLAEPGADGGCELGRRGTFSPLVACVQPPFITLSLCFLLTKLMSGETATCSKSAAG